MPPGPATSTNLRVCVQCKRFFVTSGDLNVHLKDTNHGFSCAKPGCKKICNFERALAQHIADGHSVQLQPAAHHLNFRATSNSITSFFCTKPGCKRTFKTKCAREQHLRDTPHGHPVTTPRGQQDPKAANLSKQSETASPKSKQSEAGETSKERKQEKVAHTGTRIKAGQSVANHIASPPASAKRPDSKPPKPSANGSLFSWDTRWSALPLDQYNITFTALRAVIGKSGSASKALGGKKFYTPDCKAASGHDLRAPRQRAIVLDCEMVRVGHKGITSELARVSAIDFFTGLLLVDTLVEPLFAVTDWRTLWSGVTAKAMGEAIASGKALKGSTAARTELFKFMDSQTILVGHALQYDLAALGIRHDTTVDSSVLVKSAVGKGVKREWALKTLCKELPKITVQDNGKDGHGSVEDALAAREVVLWCLQHKDELKSWGEKMRKGHTKKPQTKKRPVVPKNLYEDDSDDYEFQSLSTKEFNELCHYPEWYDNWD
ncbi:hypothetical protein E8E12_000275 [Didymella heteroderae]|uniref:C2H2-type domain-containing protein n=1 Tax=Didymella heteroderae TaxID=1769908 RepID=A0A9P4WGM8_9PLEO|nr:hypothetical protein E8E12_000275 [Didymella heteroderae]